MLTDDNENSAKAVADNLHLSAYKTEYLTQDKLEEVKSLQKEGKKVAVAGGWH